jgi:hypothetical protein
MPFFAAPGHAGPDRVVGQSSDDRQTRQQSFANVGTREDNSPEGYFGRHIVRAATVPDGYGVGTLRRRGVLRVLVVVLSGSQLGSIEPALAQSQSRDALDQLIDWRGQCYALARQVKNAFKPKDSRVVETARRYEVTRQACNAWIEKMRSRLSLGEKTDDESMRATREAFAKSVDAFKAYAEKVLGIASRNGFGAILLLVPVLVEVGVKIYDVWDKSGDERLRKVSAELDGLRFASFESL